MKTIVSFRLPALLVLLLIASLTGCKKGSNVDPAPDLAARVAGVYTYSELAAGGQSAPAKDTNLKGTVNVTRQTATTVAIKLNISSKLTNEPYLDDSADDVTVVETGNGNIEYRYGTEVLARGSGNKILIDANDSSLGPFTLTATK